MSPSSDIETLFGHFGGNAGDYQEIGRENEARSARTRWPLLVTLDLTQPPIPAVAQRRDPHTAPRDASAQAKDERAGATPADAAQAAQAAQAADTRDARAKAPLFARAHRRNIPPVANTMKADEPRGADRFAAPADLVDPVAPASGHAESVELTSPVSGAAAAVPDAQPVRASAPPAAPSFAPRPAAPAAAPGWASTPAASAVRTAQTAQTAPATPLVATTPAARHAPSILGKLFTAAASGTPPAQASGSEGVALHSVFDRLRGTANTPDNSAAGAAPHAWLSNGPRRS
jgi:hypothetical protein